MLKEAVVAYMEEIGDTSHEDHMRAFFRSHVGDIGRLLKKVADIVVFSSKTPYYSQEFLPEANRAIVVCYNGMCIDELMSLFPDRVKIRIPIPSI